MHRCFGKVDQPLPKLREILRLIDNSHFSKQIRPTVSEQQRLEHSKRFNTGGLPYGSDTRDIILVIDSITLQLRGHIGLGVPCQPYLYASAGWHTFTKIESEGTFRQYTSCSAKTHETDFVGWYGKPAAASEEIRHLISQLVQAVAAQVTSGYDVKLRARKSEAVYECR